MASHCQRWQGGGGKNNTTVRRNPYSMARQGGGSSSNGDSACQYNVAWSRQRAGGTTDVRHKAAAECWEEFVLCKRTRACLLGWAPGGFAHVCMCVCLVLVAASGYYSGAKIIQLKKKLISQGENDREQMIKMKYQVRIKGQERSKPRCGDSKMAGTGQG